MRLIVYSNDHVPLTQAHIFFFKTKNCSNYISLVAMIGLEKCCITSACLQWLCHSGERTVAHVPLVLTSPWKHTLLIRSSNDYQQHMFSCKNKKNILWIPPLICSYGDIIRWTEIPGQSAHLLSLINALWLSTYGAIENRPSVLDIHIS